MHLTLPVRKLADYGTTVLSPQAILSTVTTLPVEGGYASAKVFRHDLEFHVTDNDTRTLSVIQKYTNSQEVCIMHTISEVPGKQTFPEIIDSNPSQGGHEKECGNWFITPFYEGTTLTFEDEMPLPVVESLARLHAYFAPRLNQLEWLWRMTTDTLKEMFKKTLESLNAARIRKPDSKLTSIYNQVEKASNNQLVYTVLERLPVTLTHGDVHPGNIIDVREGTPVLLDWGNARIAPATSGKHCEYRFTELVGLSCCLGICNRKSPEQRNDACGLSLGYHYDKSSISPVLYWPLAE